MHKLVRPHVRYCAQNCTTRDRFWALASWQRRMPRDPKQSVTNSNLTADPGGDAPRSYKPVPCAHRVIRQPRSAP